MADAAVDNDVLIKLAAYRLLSDGLAALGGVGGVGVLGAARYVIPSAIARSDRIADKEGAIMAWLAVVDLVEALEPSADELAIAALLEKHAARRGLPLDTGESQLFAMTIVRQLSLVVTGDKRAIIATESLRPDVDELAALDGHVVCLEQVVERLIEVLGSHVVRSAICQETRADRALSISMSCASVPSSAPFSLDGLHSYIADIRASAVSLIGSL
jgi:hypothetical protein